ncbi:hypothetical protein AN618_18940 [Fervidicola ferrireducens]|uniref:Uncharacterized protein n=1 Tax=Fervidicola ferrireducens TaxID=520764 RepID=A0A140L4P6_9FIRM|nr:hypothetical protein [Fervidicola ferrireducens]KXG75521.1 hypothetical protein AN618_18940 [Fervidicola ferrireducens]
MPQVVIDAEKMSLDEIMATLRLTPYKPAAGRPASFRGREEANNVRMWLTSKRVNRKT